MISRAMLVKSELITYCIMVCSCIREENPFVDYLPVYTHIPYCTGSAVVECLTRDRGTAVSSLTGVTALCP